MFDFDIWFSEQAVILKNLPEKHKRYLYDKIDWNSNCIGLLGARGTGKTTLMLQQLKSVYDGKGNALYISVDNPRFQQSPLNEFAAEFHKQGGEFLFLDEVHKYPEWSKHIKAIIDTRPELKVRFSGSSLLQMNKQDADLSRRATVYHLDGLSFREYLALAHEIDIQPIAYEDLIKDHVNIAGELHSKIGKTIKYFQEYLSMGYYPFSLQDETSFHSKLTNTLNKVLETDLGFVCDIKYAKVHQLKKLLYMLATTSPYELKKTELSLATGIDRVTLNDYLVYLRDACLVNLVKPAGKGNKPIRKSEKLLLNNSNIQYAISNKVDIGTAREVFFVNQLSNYFKMQDNFLPVTVETAQSGDYIINGKTFEIGGKNKSFNQIKDIPDSYVVSDDIEIGHGNRIPLWLFGLMY
jgi:predicted AAA+ superfamily ATPase